MNDRRPATGVELAPWKTMRRWRYRLRRSLALLFSLAFHALILSLQLGEPGFGLPGLALPWTERRAPDLTVRLVQAPPPALPAPKPPKPVTPPRPAGSFDVVTPAPPRVAPPPKPASRPQRDSAEPAPAAEEAARKAAIRPKPRPRMLAVDEPRPETFNVPPPRAPEPELPRAPQVAARAPVDEPAVTPEIDPELKRQEEEARRKAEEETRRKAEVERRKEEEAGKLALEGERRKEEEAQRLAEEEARRKTDEEARRKAEEETRRKAEGERRKEEEARKLAQEAELRKAEEARKLALEEARRKAEEEARRKAEVERRKEEEARRLAQEVERRKEEEARKLAQEAERRKEEEARKLAQEAERRKAEDARKQADAQAAAERERLAAEKAQAGAATVPGALSGKELAAKVLGQLRTPGAAPIDSPRPPPVALDSSRRRSVLGAERDVVLRLYIESWRTKIERNGPLNYRPAAGMRAPDYPVVTVALRSDGSVEHIHFHRSSGLREVDNAVRRIVEFYAPYSRFPPALASQYDVIEIRRVWQLDDTLRIVEETR